MSRRFGIIAAILGMIAARTAGLAAQVQTVTTSPSSPVVNDPSTKVIVGGMNPCAHIRVDFGDGTITDTSITNLPHELPHIWTTAGQKTVKARGIAPCSGQATTMINVLSGFAILDNICEKIDCTIFFTPDITIYFGAAKPGGIAGIVGKNFGSDPGTVKANLTTWNGGSFTVDLNVTEWHNTMVGVEWPTNISGVLTHDATVQITTAAGLTSEEHIVKFTPEIVFKTLPMEDVSVTSCGTDGNADQCNDWHDPDDAGAFFPAPAGSFFGFHYNVWLAFEDDSGQDVFSVSLKNEWEFESWSFSKEVEPGEGSVTIPPQPGKVASWSTTVKWVVTQDDSVSYSIVVTIGGPAGVPHN
jgi:hypothetical protein